MTHAEFLRPRGSERGACIAAERHHRDARVQCGRTVLRTHREIPKELVCEIVLVDDASTEMLRPIANGDADVVPTPTPPSALTRRFLRLFPFLEEASSVNFRVSSIYGVNTLAMLALLARLGIYRARFLRP